MNFFLVKFSDSCYKFLPRDIFTGNTFPVKRLGSPHNTSLW